MTRHQLRILTFKLIFGVEFNSLEEMDKNAERFFENLDEDLADFSDSVSETDAEAIKSKAASVFVHLDEIDSLIAKKAEGWSIGRIGKAELAIIRLAVYEMNYDDSVPVGVAINEAVEIAKQYCDDAAPAFINGVLSKLVPEE